MFRSIVLLVGGLASLGGVSLFAQEAVLSQEYGGGVHAFFAGDYATAYEQLSSAILGGSQDPRAYYFRGLACMRLGRGPDAAIDFQKGAQLESADVHRSFNVSKALERVQGVERAELEKYRVAARLSALKRAERLRKARYEAIRREENRVLREQAEKAPPSGQEIVPPPMAAEENPFATPGEAPRQPDDSFEEDPFAAPSERDHDDEEDPFATPGEEKKKSADEEDPFATPDEKPKKPDDKKPEEKKPDEKKPDEKKPDEKKPDEKKPDEKKPDDEQAHPDDPFAE